LRYVKKLKSQMNNYYKSSLIFLIVSLVIPFSNVFGQNVGINEENPTHTLHVKPFSSGDEPLRVEGVQPQLVGDTAIFIHNPNSGIVRYITLTNLTDTLINNFTNNDAFLDSIVSIIYNYGDTLLYNSTFITNLQDSIDTHLDSLTFINNILTGWVDGTPYPVDLSDLEIEDTHLDSLTLDNNILTGWVNGTPNDVDLSGLDVEDTHLDSLTFDNNILTGWVNGTPNDVDLSSLNLDYWELTGNTGTTPPSVGIGNPVDNNFIGTTDAVDLALVTNGLERFRIKSDNNDRIRIGVGTAFTVNLNTGATPTLLHLHDWGTTANDFAVLTLSTANTAQDNRSGVINFAATQATNERRTATIESYITDDATTNVTGDLRFFTNNDNDLDERMRITGYGNVRIGSPFAPIANPFTVDVDHIKLNVTGGYTRLGNYNSDTGVGGLDPGESYFDGIGALAIGVNRVGGQSDVNFWNTTAHGQASANGDMDRGFDWRRYDSSGNEELVMSLRGDGLLTLTSNDATTEGGHLILNNAGFTGVSELNSWNIDNYNSGTSANAFRIFYNANNIPSIIIPEHTNANARVGINMELTPQYNFQVNGDMAVGYDHPDGTGVMPDYGNFLHFLGGPASGFSSNNSDPMWMARYNVASDVSELRMCIGDNNLAGPVVDKLSIGVVSPGWIPVFDFVSDGEALKPGGGTWAVLSDKRLKKDVLPFEEGLETVLRLNPVTFKYNEKSGYQIDKEYIGFIAQEVEAAAPYMVSEKDDSQGTSRLTDRKTLDESALTKLLVNAIKEQQAMIEKLEQQIHHLLDNDKQKEATLNQLNAELKSLRELILDSENADQ
jgi:hypothetical protein